MLATGGIFSDRVFKSAFYVSMSASSGKGFLEAFLPFSDMGLKKNMAFQRFFFRWSYRNCTCPQKHLQNRFCLKRYHFLNIILRQLSAIFMSRGTIQKNCSKLVTMSLSISDNGRKRSGSLGDSFRLGCNNCVLCVRVKNLRKTIFGKVKFFYLFPAVNEKLHRFLFNSFIGVDDFAFYESIETFSCKLFEKFK